MLTSLYKISQDIFAIIYIWNYITNFFICTYKQYFINLIYLPIIFKKPNYYKLAFDILIYCIYLINYPSNNKVTYLDFIFIIFSFIRNIIFSYHIFKFCFLKVFPYIINYINNRVQIYIRHLNIKINKILLLICTFLYLGDTINTNRYESVRSNISPFINEENKIFFENSTNIIYKFTIFINNTLILLYNLEWDYREYNPIYIIEPFNRNIVLDQLVMSSNIFSMIIFNIFMLLNNILPNLNFET